MRIIAGNKKGTKLVSINGDWIRPTSDKIRGAIFSSLTNYFPTINGFIDCFGGSGAMAIEALSRGAENVYCFDKNPKSIQIIKKNLIKTGYLSQINLFKISAKQGMEILEKNKVKADVFFMDPPYKKIKLVYDLLQIIFDKDLIQPSGLIVIEHDKSDIIQLNQNFRIINSKNYGNTNIDYIEINEKSSLSRIV